MTKLERCIWKHFIESYPRCKVFKDLKEDFDCEVCKGYETNCSLYISTKDVPNLKKYKKW